IFYNPTGNNPQAGSRTGRSEQGKKRPFFRRKPRGTDADRKPGKQDKPETGQKPHYDVHDYRQKVRVIAMGGLEQVGINMMLFEFGDDIIIVDMGLQFPDEGMHGIDYIIPDISYLKGKEKNIRGVIITHAHYDHIGAIPHIMQQLQGGDRIPLYGSKLTIAFIRRRQEEYQGTINLKEVDPEKDKLR